MSIPVDPTWPDAGLLSGGFRSSEEDTNYGGGESWVPGKDTRNTRDIAVEAQETTKKIKDDLTFIKERIHELVDETSNHEQERASLEKKLAGDSKYSPTIPEQDLFAINVDKLINDLGDVFQTEKEMMEDSDGNRDHINIVAAHVGHVLWEHLQLPTELYDAWMEATNCASELDKK